MHLEPSPDKITCKELVQLLHKVFPPLAGQRRLAILVDLPISGKEDHEQWRLRRNMAMEWTRMLKTTVDSGLDSIDLYAYANVGSNNADLPEKAFHVHDRLPEFANELNMIGQIVPFTEIFAGTDMFLAPTEFSTTAPLKIAAKKYGFRAATMPGFTAAMIPALRIDYGQVQSQVRRLKQLLDRATSARVVFIAQEQEYQMNFDLRFRTAHESTGVFPEPGIAGNLPSGEAYIVPYEGENEPSLTEGVLPVQFEDEIVTYQVHENRAVKVTSIGRFSNLEAGHLHDEPSYGNIAELGFGVLADFGIQPIGELLLDEKLGFHVAFGRSDHFGGMVGPSEFSSPSAVVHIDRIYIPQVQPLIAVADIVCRFQNGEEMLLMRDGHYELA
jgi:hypothetical protein